MKKFPYVLAVLVLLALGAALCWNWLRDNKLSNFSTGAELYVTPGMTEPELRDLIEEKTGSSAARASTAASRQRKWRST